MSDGMELDHDEAACLALRLLADLAGAAVEDGAITLWDMPGLTEQAWDLLVAALAEEAERLSVSADYRDLWCFIDSRRLLTLAEGGSA